MRRKVLLITEYLNPPFDEGIKKTVFNLYTDLKTQYDLKVVSRYAFDDKDIYILKTNPLFISWKLLKLINSFKPDVLIYFPFASTTFAGYLRQMFFQFYLGSKKKSVLIALQPKKISSWQRNIVKMVRPKYGLTPSPVLKQEWDRMGISNQQLPLLTDLKIFKPLTDSSEKKLLRDKYNLPKDAFIISHMGHLNEGRNLKSLIPLQKAGYQVVVVGSSSTPSDSIGPISIKEELQKEGIIILDGYINNIEEVYQLSDIYIFPVIAKTGSIGMPLSIMEARGCGIPVLTTDFGSLKHYLQDDHRSIWYAEPEHFLSTVKEIQNTMPRDFIKSNVKEINSQFHSIIHSAIRNS